MNMHADPCDVGHGDYGYYGAIEDHCNVVNDRSISCFLSLLMIIVWSLNIQQAWSVKAYDLNCLECSCVELDLCVVPHRGAWIEFQETTRVDVIGGESNLQCNWILWQTIVCVCNEILFQNGFVNILSGYQ